MLLKKSFSTVNFQSSQISELFDQLFPSKRSPILEFSVMFSCLVSSFKVSLTTFVSSANYMVILARSVGK